MNASFLVKYFDIARRGSSVGIEVMGGITTFIAMSYIIFVQPLILSGRMFDSATGMDFNALITATCLAAAFGSILMGVAANYPIALAPGMGENFFFVLTVIPACAAISGGVDWQLALGVVFIAGVLFALLSLLNVRYLILKTISHSMRHAIAGGIGLFIALIGLENGGLVVAQGGHYGLTGELASGSLLVFGVGLAVTAATHVLKWRGSILIGILAGAGTALALGEIGLVFPFGVPPSPAPVFARFDIAGVVANLPRLLPFIAIFLFMDIFDTLGTLVGVASEAGLMKNKELPNSKRAFAADATATLFGSVCGNSTVTAYIESAAGVSCGARTGFAAVITGICFLAAPLLTPFIGMISSCKAITAPALIVVGAMMLKGTREIDWDDASESIPAFMVLIGIPFTYSIGDGIILGFIAYPAIKLLGGKGRSISWVSYLLAALLIIYLLTCRNMT